MCYVYIHVIGDEIVWVGKGRNGRVYDSKRVDPEHEEFIVKRQELGDFSYGRIHTAGMSDKDASELEEKLIRDLNPKFNRVKYVRKSSRVYPNLTPEEAMALGSKNALKSPNIGKRGKSRKLK